MNKYFYLAQAVNSPEMKTSGIVEAYEPKEALDLAQSQAECDFDFINMIIVQFNKVS